jgi:HSP90 family molecular chaperone
MRVLLLLLLSLLQVAGVKLSKRLSSTPCVVVASKWGQSANMERIMKASVSVICDMSHESGVHQQVTCRLNIKETCKVTQVKCKVTKVVSVVQRCVWWWPASGDNQPTWSAA